MANTLLLGSGIILEGIPQFGSQTITGTLSVSGVLTTHGRTVNLVTKTTTYTVLTTDEIVLCDATLGAFTVTLPSATTAAAGHKVLIVKLDSSANAITVSRAGSDTIEGATTKSLAAQYDKIGLASDGSTIWYDLGTGGK